MGASNPPRIVMAIIFACKGDKEKARELLARQILNNPDHGHPEFVRKLADKLSLGDLNF
jgi:hypothetical protein